MSKFAKFDEWKAILRQMHENSDAPTPGAMLIAHQENEWLKRNRDEMIRRLGLDESSDDIPCDTEGE